MSMSVTSILATMKKFFEISEWECVTHEEFTRDFKDEVNGHISELGFTIIPDFFLDEEDIRYYFPDVLITVAFKTIIDDYLPCTFYKVERFALPLKGSVTVDEEGGLDEDWDHSENREFYSRVDELWKEGEFASLSELRDYILPTVMEDIQTNGQHWIPTSSFYYEDVVAMFPWLIVGETFDREWYNLIEEDPLTPFEDFFPGEFRFYNEDVIPVCKSILRAAEKGKIQILNWTKLCSKFERPRLRSNCKYMLCITRKDSGVFMDVVPTYAPPVD